MTNRWRKWMKRVMILVAMVSGLALVMPKNIFAVCSVTLPCTPYDLPGCLGKSAACVNGSCHYTWNCTDTCNSWSGWAPDPCAAGDFQTRWCTQNGRLGSYQIQACGSAACFVPGTIVEFLLTAILPASTLEKFQFYRF